MTSRPMTRREVARAELQAAIFRFRHSEAAVGDSRVPKLAHEVEECIARLEIEVENEVRANGGEG